MHRDEWYVTDTVGRAEVHEAARKAARLTGRPPGVHEHPDGAACGSGDHGCTVYGLPAEAAPAL